jgi:hypothetical protein
MSGLLSFMYHSRNSTLIGARFDYVFSETLVNFSMAGYGVGKYGLPGFDTNRVCCHAESEYNPALQEF